MTNTNNFAADQGRKDVLESTRKRLLTKLAGIRCFRLFCVLSCFEEELFQVVQSGEGKGDALWYAEKLKQRTIPRKVDACLAGISVRQQTGPCR